MRVLICGGGVIGAAIAYFLSLRSVEAVVIERTGLACAASGKSGGFLALDWCDGSPLEALARRSFALHAALPEQIGGDWGYRRMTTYSGFTRAGAHGSRKTQLGWLSDNVSLDRRLGATDTTAQVDPRAFTTAMMRAAETRGARLQRGRVTGIVRGPTAAGVELDGEIIKGDAVVIAMGPWSMLAARWLPLPGVSGLKGHSLIFETGNEIPPEAIFLDYQEASGDIESPEVFPRANGTTYVCAIRGTDALPGDPAEVAPEPGAIERLHAMCAQLSPVLARARVLARQACYRPIAEYGLPLIGRVPGIAGAYVATGHSVWGILNAPATGEAIAELLVDGATRSVDLSPFDPGRFSAGRQ